jgi:hypothetical protein
MGILIDMGQFNFYFLPSVIYVKFKPLSCYTLDSITLVIICGLPNQMLWQDHRIMRIEGKPE